MAQGSGKYPEIKQFRYSSDNLGYLVYSGQYAVAVDGGAVEDILLFLQSNNISLQYIANTHSHGDHTVGNKKLLENSDARYIDFKALTTSGLDVDGFPFQIYKTPGHTADSIILRVGDKLITGDTLFIGKVGRCFSGDLKEFLKSIKIIMDFPDDSIIYPGHDYVHEYMEFVRKFDCCRQYIDKVTASYNPELVRSTLGLEKKLNPFLRINDKKIIALLEERGLAAKTEYDRWQSMISLM